MTSVVNLDSFGSFLSLTALETVLGVDNVIFLTILVGKLPKQDQTFARRTGLVLALGMRICLLLTLSWLASFRSGLFTVAGHAITGRDLVLIVGGGFLIFKSTWEIFSGLEGDDQPDAKIASGRRMLVLVLTLIQISVMDIVFSLDSVVTAVGIAKDVRVMIGAMVCSMFIMLGFAKPIGDFVEAHPSMKILALSFLVMIGTLLVAEGGGQSINKGYVYFSMGFSVLIEFINIYLRKKTSSPVELHSRSHSASHPPDPLEENSIQQLQRTIEEQALRIAELEQATGDRSSSA
jgi:predicted tellurium resistance membrane protein TerC